MNIFISDISNLTPLVIPITPPNYKVEIGGDNVTEDTINGKINIIKNAKLSILSWSSVFPVKSHIGDRSVSIPDGWVYVGFLKGMKTLKLPIRIVATRDNNVPMLNMLATIEEFSYSVDTAGDIQYTIKLKETPERIYEFFLRDVEYVKKGWNYLKRFFTESEKLQKLKNAGLFITEQRYK